MKAVVTDKRPCVLCRGEMRRVPQNRASNGIVGYHVCCPRCGFVTAVLQGTGGLDIAESADGAAVTFSKPAKCAYCSALMRLNSGELTAEEGADVRDVCYRQP